MSKTYKMSAYYVDPNDMYSADDFMNIASNMHVIAHQVHVETSNPYEWNDDVPENYENCDLANLEERFDHDKSVSDVKVGALYKHFKGHIVKVIAVSRGTEYGEWNVVYEHMGNHTIWHRPIAMFCSKVDSVKYPEVEQEYRFQLM